MQGRCEELLSLQNGPLQQLTEQRQPGFSGEPGWSQWHSESTLPKSDGLKMGPRCRNPDAISTGWFLGERQRPAYHTATMLKRARKSLAAASGEESDKQFGTELGSLVPSAMTGRDSTSKWKRDLRTSHGPWPFWPLNMHKGNFNLPGINLKCVNKKIATATALK